MFDLGNFLPTTTEAICGLVIVVVTSIIIALQLLVN